VFILGRRKMNNVTVVGLEVVACFLKSELGKFMIRWTVEGTQSGNILEIYRGTEMF
jgi:hypothetical protein